jgi:hypothetical protein
LIPYLDGRLVLEKTVAPVIVTRLSWTAENSYYNGDGPCTMNMILWKRGRIKRIRYAVVRLCQSFVPRSTKVIPYLGRIVTAYNKTSGCMPQESKYSKNTNLFNHSKLSPIKKLNYRSYTNYSDT